MNEDKGMTHILFYLGLSGLVILAVLFIFLVKMQKKKKPEPEVFEIK